MKRKEECEKKTSRERGREEKKSRKKGEARAKKQAQKPINKDQRTPVIDEPSSESEVEEEEYCIQG